MNTDNMAISGETIDYGHVRIYGSVRFRRRCSARSTAADATPTDACRRIAQWNLARFAETLLPLIDEAEQDRAVERATEVFAAVSPSCLMRLGSPGCAASLA